MVEFAPSTGGLALWIRHQDVRADADVQTVMTDGNTIYYGAAFNNLPLREQTGLVAHEVLHVALRHPQRFLDLQRLIGDVDLQLFTTCADAIVNSTLEHLAWLRLPAGSVYLDRLLVVALGMHEDAQTALLRWDVEALYRAIDDRLMPDQNSRQQARNNGSSSASASSAGSSGRGGPRDASDNQAPRQRQDGRRSAVVRTLGARGHADLIPNEATQCSAEAEAEQAREHAERLLRGHVNDGDFSMLRALIADLPRVRTPWEQVLRTRLARALAPRPSVSWSRPTRSYIANQGRSGTNRRLPWEPGFSQSAWVPRIAVIVDVSGSVDAELMARFAHEIEAIARRQEAGLVLIVGDNRVRRVEVFKAAKADLRNIEFHGGGGTDFTPLLEEADKYRPDIGVVLTDLEGPARFRPRWPVIWTVPGAHTHAVPPFGRKLVLSD
jgi:hypothetical protein